MQRRGPKAITTIAAALVVAVAGVMLWVQRDEFLAWWHVGRLDSGTVDQKVASAQWLAERGRKEAIPALAALVESTDIDLVAAAAKALVALGDDGVAALEAPFAEFESEWQLYVIRALDLVAPTDADGDHVASDAITEHERLVTWLVSLAVEHRGSELRGVAGDALAGVGRPAVPALVERLKGDDRQEHRNALYALRRLGPQAVDAIDAIEPFLANEHGTTSAAAFGAIRSMGAAGVPAFVRLMKRTDAWDKRSHVMCTLRGMGPLASGAVDLLLEWLATPPDDRVLLQPSLATTLARIAPDDPRVVDALAKALADPEPRVGQGAASGLEIIGPEAKAALPALWALMRRESTAREGVRRTESVAAFVQAAEAIVRVDADADALLAFLAGLLASDDLECRRRAGRAIAAIGAPAAPLVSALLDSVVSAGAIDADARKDLFLVPFRRLGDATHSWLQKAFDDPRPAVRCAAFEAYASSPRALPMEAPPRLLKALDDDDDDVRYAVAAALTAGLAERKFQKAIGPIVAALDEPDDVVRGQLVSALKFGPNGSPQVIEALLACARDASAVVRREAVVSIDWHADPNGRFGSDGDAIPVFLTALADVDAGVRDAAVRAIDKLQNEPSEEALTRIARLLGDYAPLPANPRLTISDIALSFLRKQGLRAMPSIARVVREEGRGASTRAVELLRMAGYDIDKLRNEP